MRVITNVKTTTPSYGGTLKLYTWQEVVTPEAVKAVKKVIHTSGFGVVYSSTGGYR